MIQLIRRSENFFYNDSETFRNFLTKARKIIDIVLNIFAIMVISGVAGYAISAYVIKLSFEKSIIVGCLSSFLSMLVTACRYYDKSRSSKELDNSSDSDDSEVQSPRLRILSADSGKELVFLGNEICKTPTDVNDRTKFLRIDTSESDEQTSDSLVIDSVSESPQTLLVTVRKLSASSKQKEIDSNIAANIAEVTHNARPRRKDSHVPLPNVLNFQIPECDSQQEIDEENSD